MLYMLYMFYTLTRENRSSPWPPLLSCILIVLMSNKIDKYRVELSWKKCKTVILLYFSHTAGVLYTILSPGTSFYRKKFTWNYLIFSKSILWRPVMYPRVHFNIIFTLDSLNIHFSINFIKRRNCNGYIYCDVLRIICEHLNELYTLNSCSGSKYISKKELLICFLF